MFDDPRSELTRAPQLPDPLARVGHWARRGFETCGVPISRWGGPDYRGADSSGHTGVNLPLAGPTDPFGADTMTRGVWSRNCPFRLPSVRSIRSPNDIRRKESCHSQGRACASPRARV